MQKILLISVAFLLLSGCYMAPLALMGPATSGFSTASIMQSAVSATANHVVKKSTGKSINQHVLESVRDTNTIQRTYLPKSITNIKVKP